MCNSVLWAISPLKYDLFSYALSFTIDEIIYEYCTGFRNKKFIMAL